MGFADWEDSTKQRFSKPIGRILKSRIQRAEAAMKGRLQEFSLDHGGTPEENRAIQQALSVAD